MHETPVWDPPNISRESFTIHLQNFTPRALSLISLVAPCQERPHLREGAFLSAEVILPEVSQETDLFLNLNLCVSMHG